MKNLWFVPKADEISPASFSVGEEISLQDEDQKFQDKYQFDVGSWEGKTLPQVTEEVLRQVEKIYLERVLLKGKGTGGAKRLQWRVFIHGGCTIK